MKISIKILYAFLLLVILIATVSFIYVRSVSEVEPSETLDDEFVKRNIAAEAFQTIVVKRGNWNISVNRSDSFYVILEAGDNVIENYVKARIIDEKLMLDIDSAIISDMHLTLKASVGMKSLNLLTLEKKSVFSLHNFDEKNLDLNIKDGDVALWDCTIQNLNLNVYGGGSVIDFDSQIENAECDLKDSAYVLMSRAINISTNIEDLAVFVRLGEDYEPLINTSEKRRELTNQMSSYFNSLKWFMPYDIALQIMKSDSANYRETTTYRDNLIKNLISEMSFYTLTSFENKSEKNQGLKTVQLIFSRGLLVDIVLDYFYKDEDKIEELKSKFEDKYYEPELETIPEYYLGDSPKDHMYKWIISENKSEEIYTTIRYFHYASNRVSIIYSVSDQGVFSNKRTGPEFDNLPEMRSFPNIIDSFAKLFDKTRI